MTNNFKAIVLMYFIIQTSLCYSSAGEGDETKMFLADGMNTIFSALPDDAQQRQDILWAVNVGGEAYYSAKNIFYMPDEGVLGGKIITTKEEIKASPDSRLYQAARQGSLLSIERPVKQGRYSITLRFAAIDGYNPTLMVSIENQRIPEVFNIHLRRDKQVNANYDITIPNIDVYDGELNVLVEGDAILNAFEVLHTRESKKSDNWEIVWEDDFEKPNLDRNKWNVVEWEPKSVNDELQSYTARKRNVRIEEGKLVIEAHRDFYNDNAFSSGRVNTRGKMDLTYGRIEAVAKLPKGRGVWSAIWLMPSDYFRYATNCRDEQEIDGILAECDLWPNSGEIDFVENVGWDGDIVHGTMHSKAYYWKNMKQRKASIYLPRNSQDFVSYAMEWSPEKIDLYADNVLYFSYVNDGSGNWESWPFDHPFHLVANVAVGGGWGAQRGIDPDIWPQRLEIESFKVFKQKRREAIANSQ